MVKRFLVGFFAYFILIIAATLGGMFLMSKHIIGIGGYIAIIIISVVIPLIFFNKLVLNRVSKKDREILQNGVEADAEIISIQDTGVTINNIYINVKMLLKVIPQFGSPFEINTSHLVSRVNIPRPGDMLRVKYSKNDLTKVVILDKSAAQVSNQVSNQANEDAARKMLLEIDAQNKALLANGIESKAIVKKYNDLGIFVNGNNPLVELELEVTPADKPKFFAIAKAPILETSINKYKEGNEISVKYDPNDLTKVTLFHS